MTTSANPLEADFLRRGQPGGPAPDPASASSPIEAGSSEWWLARLTSRLSSRNVRLAELRSYYLGTNSTWLLANRAFRDTFGSRFKDLRVNLAQPVVEVVEQRMLVTGLEFPGDGAGSDRAWDIWQQNTLDARSSDAHLELLSTGICPVLVDPWATVAPGVSLITVEDPLSVYVEHDPADPRTRVAAVKVWPEDDGRQVAILYLPDRIEWWRQRPGRRSRPSWERLAGGGPNPLGVVPVVELRNAPRARAEHEGIIDQLRLIAAALYRLTTAAHYTSYRQKWATGVSEDEEGTEMGEDGRPVSSPPASASADPDTVTTAESPDARFGTFEQSDMVPFIREIEMHQSHVATISSTPHRLLLPPPTSVPASGEAVRLEDLPLTQKIERKFTTVGNGWETVTRLAFLAAGDAQRGRRMDLECWWKDPQPYTLSELMDALTKAQSLGVPKAELWRRYGATPRQIREWQTADSEGVPDAQD